MAKHKLEYPNDRLILPAFKELGAFLETLFQPSRQDASGLQALARALLVVRRLPNVTPDLTGGLIVVTSNNDMVKACWLKVETDLFDDAYAFILSDIHYKNGATVKSEDYLSLRTDGEIEGFEKGVTRWIAAVKELLEAGASVADGGFNDKDDIDWETLENADVKKRDLPLFE